MKKLIYALRGYLICYGIIGNIYKTKWRDTNPNKNYTDPLFWMKYHYTDELWSPHAFYGRLGRYTSTKLFTYEYTSWIVDCKNYIKEELRIRNIDYDNAEINVFGCKRFRVWDTKYIIDGTVKYQNLFGGTVVNSFRYVTDRYGNMDSCIFN